MVNSNVLKIKIIGGGDHIGANSYLLETEDIKILLDCGISQKYTDYESLPNIERIGNNLDTILISHAHLDHIGSLPVLMDHFYEAKVWMTSSTRKLSSLVVKDTSKILKYRSSDIGALPYYTLYDTNRFENQLKKIQAVEYEKTFHFKGTDITFYNAGHIIGSAMIKIHFTRSDIKVLYTGDFSARGGRIEEKPDFTSLGDIDLLISECTYGGGTSKARDIPMGKFIKGCLKKNGRVLIPAFGIGRTQDVLGKLHDLKQKGEIPSNIEIFVSGMGTKVNSIYLQSYGDKVSFIRDIKSVYTKNLKNKKKYICVATSGMVMEGTPSYTLAQDILPDRTSGILFPTSFEAEEAIGYKTMSRGERVRFGTRKIKRNCALNNTDFSAHVSRNNLIKTIKHIKPACVLFVHPGDVMTRDKLARDVQRKHVCTVFYPQTSAEEFDITKRNGEVTMNSSANTKVAIITVGTSILSNAKKKKIDPNDETILFSEVKKDPKFFSAELNTFLGIDEAKRKCGKIILLASAIDEGKGKLCNKLLTRYFTELGLSVELIKIPGLGKNAKKILSEGLPNFVDTLINKIEQYNSESYIIATGGFKATTAYATLIGAIFKRTIYYVHEDWETVISLRHLPIYFDAIYNIDPTVWKKFNDMMYAKTLAEADRIYEKFSPEIQDFFHKENGKYFYTAIGRLTTRAYIHSEITRRGKFESITTAKFIKGIMTEHVRKIIEQRGRRKTKILLSNITDLDTRSLLKKILEIFAVEDVIIKKESVEQPSKKLSERIAPRGNCLFYSLKTGKGGGLDIDINVLSGTEKKVKSILKKINKQSSLP